jgi:hypothetical protein
MKKLIFVMFFVLVSGQLVENKARASDSFKCDGRTHCSQMTSCEEVLFFLKNCPNVQMNGNNNSISCEKQWCKNATSPQLSNSNKISSSSFKCDGRTHCSQMTSCAEATFFLRNCPNVKMDGDGDGIPCEDQWCKR